MGIRWVSVGLLIAAKWVLAGNGAGYGGGENQALKQVRDQLTFAMRLIKDGGAPNFADASGCQKMGEPKLCATLASLTDGKRETLSAWVKTAAPELLKLLTSASLQLEVTDQALSVPGVDGKPLSVGAKTSLGKSGPIIFHGESTRLLSPLSLAALAAHELGHKVVTLKKPLTDNESYQGFSEAGGGRELLDAFGAAVALVIAESTGATPLFFPEHYGCVKAEQQFLFSRAPAFPQPAERSLASLGGQASKAASRFLNDNRAKEFSIWVWAKAEATHTKPTVASILLSTVNYGSGGSGGLELARLKNGHAGAFLGGEEVLDLGVPLEAGKFHLLGLSLKDGMVQFVIDGKKVTTITSSLREIKSDLPALIGQGQGKPETSWNGNIASVTFIKRALTAKEWAQEWNCGNAEP